MNPRAPGTPASFLRSRACAFWLLFSLLSQLIFALHHTVAIGGGTEICTSEGSKRLYGDDGSAEKTSHHHDCCCTEKPAAPPASRLDPVQDAAGVLTSNFVSADRLAAQWLAPLSRGPPTLS